MPLKVTFASGKYIGKMTITTFIMLAAYITGVWTAYFQLLRWHGGEPNDDRGAQLLFMLSMLSWLIYPVYWITKLIYINEED